MNHISLIGRLTRKVELYRTPDNKVYTRFHLAVKRKRKTGGHGDTADFIPCVIWGKSAENLVAWTDKGAQISLEGDIRTRSYEKEGQRQFSVEVWATYFQVLSNPKQSQVAEKTSPPQQESFFKGQSTAIADDYPF